MPAKPLTELQKAESAKLRELFTKWQHDVAQRDGKKPSQLYAAEQLEITQGALNQYLNGKIPLNMDAALNFAKLLECEVLDFSESIHNEIINKIKHFTPLHTFNSGDSADQSKDAISVKWPFGDRITPEQYSLLDVEQKANIENRIRIFLDDNAIKSQEAAKQASN